MGFTDLFKPKYKHSDSSVRKKAVRKITDEKLLTEIAKNDPSNSVRGEAVQKIKNQNTLKEIIKTEPYSFVKFYAFRNIENRGEYLKTITNEDLLCNIAKEDDDENICSQAVKQISDVYYLKDIATHFTWDLKDENISMEAVKQIMNPQTLQEITRRKLISYNVKCEATKALIGITDDEEILFTFLQDPRTSVDNRLAALEKITDKELLERNLRRQNQKLCPRCHGNNLDSNTGLITAHNVPYRKYIDNPDKFCRDCKEYIAPHKLISDNQEIYEKTAERLKELFYEIPDFYENRYDKIEKISDQKVLESIVSDKNLPINDRKVALEKITDQVILGLIAIDNYDNNELFLMAKNKITDEKISAHVKLSIKKIKKIKK